MKRFKVWLKSEFQHWLEISEMKVGFSRLSRDTNNIVVDIVMINKRIAYWMPKQQVLIDLENILRVALSAAKDEAATRIENVRYIQKALNLIDTLKSI